MDKLMAGRMTGTDDQGDDQGGDQGGYQGFQELVSGIGVRCRIAG